MNFLEKEMRLLKDLVGDDPDAPAPPAAALPLARWRVVIKPPRRILTPDEPRPAMRITAENTRFDVYWST